MSKLNIDQKTVKGLFFDTQADYLIINGLLKG